MDGKSCKTNRIIEPHYLLLTWPVWYVLGWDELRESVRMFRTDRISSLSDLQESFKRRPKSIFLVSNEECFVAI